MLATRADYLRLKASTTAKCNVNVCFEIGSPSKNSTFSILFHPFPGRSDPSTSVHRVSQGQYQERPALCSLTIGKRCGRLVSEVVAQSKPNQPGRYPQIYLTRLWALMIWSSTNVAWFYCCVGNISTKSSGQAFWMCSKHMQVDFSCLMTLVMMMMKKMKWSCPFSQGSSLPVFIQKRRAVSIVSLKTGAPMIHTCGF